MKLRKQKKKESREVNQVVLPNDEETISKFIDEPIICPKHAMEIESKLKVTDEDTFQKVVEVTSDKFLLYIDEEEYDRMYGTGRWSAFKKNLKAKGNCIFCLLENTSLLEDVVKEVNGE